MESVVVDTDVVSFWFKGDTRAVGYRRHLIGKLLVIAFFSVAELDEWAVQRRWGAERRKRMERHLQRFLFFPVDRQLCQIWADVRESSRRAGRLITHADAWVAATALACGASLVTHNSGDYQGVTGLSLISEST
ncbi:MAG: PIN domain-containing protein [Pirellulales bacterium]